jgi:RNA polymerase sigma factor (sigma-70 family)
MKAERKFTDSEIITALGNSKEINKGIEQIYQLYAEYVGSFIKNYGGNEQDAEDVFQETVIALIGIIQNEKYRMESSLKTFMVSIAKNIWFNQLKKNNRSGEREKIFENNRDKQETDISHLISDQEMKKELRELVYKLDEACRKILILFYYENLSMKEIVNHLPYENDQVVRNKKYKCLQNLTQLIRDTPGMAIQIKEIVNL